MLKVIKREFIDRIQWDEAAGEFVSAWAWHYSDLIDARSKWSRTFDKSFAVVDEQKAGEICALVPVVLVESGRGAKLLGGILESTGGVALNQDLPKRTAAKTWSLISSELRRLASENRARRIDLSAPPLAPDLIQADRVLPNPFSKLGVLDRSTQTWMLALASRSEDDLWKNLEHRSRKEVKKAKSNNLTVEYVQQANGILDRYYQLHQDTCARNNIATHPVGYFEAIFGPVAARDMVRTVIVRDNNRQIISVHNFLLCKHRALYWTTASHESALKLSANDFGLWHAICSLRQDGIIDVECGEAFPGATAGKLKGLNDFKRSFGGELYPYYRGSICYRPISDAFAGLVRAFGKVR